MLWVIGVACAVVALGVLLWVWADAIEPRLFRIRRVSLCAADLGLPAMRILHITDTHLHGGDGAILSFLRDLAAREQFDLVCYTGDLVHNDGGVPSLATVAGLFSPRLGSFAVLGGHDYADIPSRSIARRLLAGPDPISSHPPNAIDGVIQALETQGVCLLQDGHERVRAPDGSELAIVGLGDTYVATPDVASAWDGLSDQVPVILVAHSPDVLPDVAGRGARLALFGHTHGGRSGSRSSALWSPGATCRAGRPGAPSERTGPPSSSTRAWGRLQTFRSASCADRKW